MSIVANALYRSDCLAVLERTGTESVTLTYLDPPLLAKSRIPPEPEDRSQVRDHLMLLARTLQQVKRVLTKTGLIYFHSEPRLTGRIRLILDQVFSEANFRSEYIWPTVILRHVRTIPAHDTIFLYSKTDDFVVKPIERPLTEEEVRRTYSLADEGGRYRLLDLTAPVARPLLRFEWHGFVPPPSRSWRFTREKLDEYDCSGMIAYPPSKGLPRLKGYLKDAAVPMEPVGSVWDDITALGSRSHEQLGYPGQKPSGLLDRIIESGSNVGDVVLDPFCGTGTSLVAAQRHSRRWIGCDVNVEAYGIALRRLCESLQLAPGTDFVTGDQGDVEIRHDVVDSSYVPVAVGYDDLVLTSAARYVLNHPLQLEETRHYEFKEVKGTNPLDSIRNTADEYVVAFLNSEGGMIFWGVRDSDRKVVGVRLGSQERDRLRLDVSGKLQSIQPAVDPTQYRIDIDPVEGEDGKTIPDVCVVRIVVPRVLDVEPYFTGGGECFVRVDGRNQKLKGPALTDYIRRRVVP